MTVARPIYNKEQDNLAWLQELNAATNAAPNGNIPLENYWVIQPVVSNEVLKSLAINNLDKISSVLFCDISMDVYRYAISPYIKNRAYNLVGFDGIGFEIMADLILNLDFSRIRKIGIRNLDKHTLWLLYSKLLCWESAGNHNISVVFGNGISQEWKNDFLGLKVKNTLTKKMLSNVTEVYKNLIDKIEANTREREKRRNICRSRDILFERSLTAQRDFTAAKAELTETSAALSNTIAALESEKEVNVNQINELTAMNEGLKKQIEDLNLFSHPEVEELRSLLHSKEISYNAMLDDLRAKLRVAATDLDQKNSQIERLINTKTERDETTARSEVEVQTISLEIKKLQDANKLLMRKNAELASSLEKEKTTSSALTDNVNDLQLAWSALHEEHAQVKADQANNQILMSALQKTNAMLVTEKDNIKNNYKDLERRIDNEVNHSSARSYKQDSHSSPSHSKKDDKHFSNKKEKDDSPSSSSHNESHSSKRKEKEDKNSSSSKKQKTEADNTQDLLQQISSLRQELNISNMNLQTLHNTVDSYAQTFKNKDMAASKSASEIARLKIELSAAKRRVPNLEKRLKEREDELQSLKQKLEAETQFDFLNSHFTLSASESSSSLSSFASNSYRLSLSPFSSPQISPLHADSNKSGLNSLSLQMSPLASNSVFKRVKIEDSDEDNSNSYLLAPEIPHLML